MKTAIEALPIKSTNVRIESQAGAPEHPGGALRFPRAFPRIDVRRSSLQLLSWLAPTIAARSVTRAFLTPPLPRRLSPKSRALFERADDRFVVKLDTELGGIREITNLSVTLWGRGPAVYLLHGWGGRGAQWAAFVDGLVSAGFTAVVFDAPGHGDSPAPRTSILHFAAALEAVVASTGPARALVGHSLGGAAAALAVRRGLDAEGLILVGAPADPAEFFDTFLDRAGIPARLRQGMRADVERRYTFRWDELAVKPPVGRPAPAALVVHDENDAEVSFADGARIARAWPGAELLQTRKLGHQRILRDEDVIRQVTTWIGAAR